MTTGKVRIQKCICVMHLLFFFAFNVFYVILVHSEIEPSSCCITLGHFHANWPVTVKNFRQWLHVGNPMYSVVVVVIVELLSRLFVPGYCLVMTNTVNSR